MKAKIAALNAIPPQAQSPTFRTITSSVSTTLSAIMSSTIKPGRQPAMQKTFGRGTAFNTGICAIGA